MIVVEVKELEDWSTYCKGIPNVKQYENKTVEHWDDICVLVGSDTATGDGVEDSATTMDTEGPNDEESGSKGTSSGSNKRLKKYCLADVVSDFANTFKLYVTEKQKSLQPPSRLHGPEIHVVISIVYGIQSHQVLRAMKRFMDDTFGEFEMLKCCPRKRS